MTRRHVLEDAQPLGNAVELVRADSVEIKPEHWLWEDFIPAEDYMLIAGAKGCGKTTLACTWAAVVTHGGKWPDDTTCRDAGDVVIWSSEDGHSRLAARLEAAGADMRRVHFVGSLQDGSPFDPAGDIPLLEATIEKLSEARMLILDPIVSAVEGDSHKNAEVRRSLQPIVDLAHRRRCCVLGISHFSKGTKGQHSTERVTGSYAFAALARVVLAAAKSPREEKDEDDVSRGVVVISDSNMGRTDRGFPYVIRQVEVRRYVTSTRIEWGEELRATARELLAEAEADPDTDRAPKLEAAKLWLRDRLSSGEPVEVKRLEAEARAVGHSPRTLQEAANSIGVIKSPAYRGQRGTWTLPVDVQEKDASMQARKHARDEKPSHPITVRRRNAE